MERVRRLLALAAVAALGGCFNPQLKEDVSFQCDPGDANACPEGYHCVDVDWRCHRTCSSPDDCKDPAARCQPSPHGGPTFCNSEVICSMPEELHGVALHQSTFQMILADGVVHLFYVAENGDIEQRELSGSDWVGGTMPLGHLEPVPISLFDAAWSDSTFHVVHSSGGPPVHYFQDTKKPTMGLWDSQALDTIATTGVQDVRLAARAGRVELAVLAQNNTDQELTLAKIEQADLGQYKVTELCRDTPSKIAQRKHLALAAGDGRSVVSFSRPAVQQGTAREHWYFGTGYVVCPPPPMRNTRSSSRPRSWCRPPWRSRMGPPETRLTPRRS